MAQTTQIVPKYPFPYVETVINDYTVLGNEETPAEVDNSVKMAFAVTSGKGIDNTWVRCSSRAGATNIFGESNYKKYGQPLMQALHVLDQGNSNVWMMRVMPENATYANAVVSAYFKADTAEEVADAHLRKFRVKLTSKSFADVTSKEVLAKKAEEFDGTAANGSYKDAEGYEQKQIMQVRYSGRGTCGDLFSMRIAQAPTYDNEYGIKFYNFEVLDSETGLEKEANYVGGLVTSAKYGSETATLINDILEAAEAGVAPVDVYSMEENIEAVYDAYIKFCQDLHPALEEEYEAKKSTVPEDMLNGTVPVTDEYLDAYNELKEIEALIVATEDENLPDVDEFDIIFGLNVGATAKLPAIYYPTLLTSDVDITAEDYNAADYTSTENLVDFSSTFGLELKNGSNGYFDAPRKITVEGQEVQWTVEQEINECYNNAFNGTYDRKILSAKRMNISAFFDAGYDFKVKQTIVDLALLRNDCRVYLDTGIIESLSVATIKTLTAKYAIFNDRLISVDIHNYFIKEPSTNKRVRVTISYFLAANYVNHITNVGFYVPMVKNNAVLTGHIKDSLLPVIDDTDTAVKTLLYNNRFNYFECTGENSFRRAVQNTRQVAESDLLEENNITILYTLKRGIENNIGELLYDFTKESTRNDFRTVQKAIYNPWIGNIIEDFDIVFQTSEYEFNHSILHAYVEVTFLGMYKRAIVEIDINKRQYTGTSYAVVGETV